MRGVGDLVHFAWRTPRRLIAAMLALAFCSIVAPALPQTTIWVSDKWLRDACALPEKAICHLWLDGFLNGYLTGFLAYGANQQGAKFCVPPGGLPLEAIAALFMANPLPKDVDGTKIQAAAIVASTLAEKFPCRPR
jgi:hypothetical protein